jgi:hypothetical protein
MIVPVCPTLYLLSSWITVDCGEWDVPDVSAGPSYLQVLIPAFVWKSWTIPLIISSSIEIIPFDCFSHAFLHPHLLLHVDFDHPSAWQQWRENRLREGNTLKWPCTRIKAAASKLNLDIFRPRSHLQNDKNLHYWSRKWLNNRWACLEHGTFCTKCWLLTLDTAPRDGVVISPASFLRITFFKYRSSNR